MLCFARSFTLLAFAVGFAAILASQAQSGSGTKTTGASSPATSQEQPMASEGMGLSDAQRQLCLTAFSNGSGTKFTDQAAFDEACMALFPSAPSGQADTANES